MIQLEKIRLRAIEPEDASKYFEWINQSDTNYWRGMFPPTSHASAQTWIADQTKAGGDQFSLAIDVKKDADTFAPVGFVGLRKICTRSRRAELWIYIGDKSFWSKGVGEQAIGGLCKFAFEELNLFRIWLECNPEYKAGIRCYQKVGFIEEGRLRQSYYRRGELLDTVIMGLLRSDWGARK